jgi:hypothetical protein
LPAGPYLLRYPAHLPLWKETFAEVCVSYVQGASGFAPDSEEEPRSYDFDNGVRQYEPFCCLPL